MRRALDAVRRVLGATVGRFFQLLLVGGIVAYRKVLSPMLGPRCRYYPSCSAYGLEAVQVHGAAKGAALTVWRICRCNPWTRGGVDHVPPKGAWKPDPYEALEDHRGLLPGRPAEVPPTDPHDHPDRPPRRRSAA